MSALPSPAFDGPTPAHRAPGELPLDGRATVVPLIPGAPVPVRVIDAPASGFAERMIVRRALFERLAGARAVAVVSAPAAGGKTCLVGSWIADAGLEAHAGWATVSPDERDERRFWLSVSHALAGIAGAEQLAPISSASHLGPELIVERLLSGLAALRQPGVLVIDDLHELRSAQGRSQLEHFLTRVPAQLRVVLLTRAAMGLGLHRLRLAGALTELRAAELRFSLEETRALLDGAGVALSDAAVARLQERTEGWIGGLRLAVAQLTEHPDPERFAREFSGSERTVAEYLRAEVLERQPPEVRDLLLRTSVLERVSGPLADALAGGSGSERVLQELDEAGAFVTALDAGRSWFRCHPMFSDLLRLELRRVSPRLEATLHRAAGRWHEAHGDVIEAIRHTQAAGDWPEAARILADHQLALIADGRMTAVRDVLDAFPPQAAGIDAELSLALAKARAFDGLDDECAAHADDAERLAGTLPEGRRARFELSLAASRLWLARLRGDARQASEAYRLTEAALRAQPSTRRSLRQATALLNVGIAELSSLRLDDGRRHLEQALALARRIGRPYVEMGCHAHLALAAAHAGLPVTAARGSAEQAVAIAEAHGWDTDNEAAAAFAVDALTLAWLGRVEDGAGSLERGRRALVHGGAPAIEVLLDTVGALGLLARGRVVDALAALRAAEPPQRVLPDAHPFRIDLRGRVLRAQLENGEAAAARAALADMPPAQRELPEIRLAAAALAIAGGCPEAALDELAPVLESSAAAVYPVMTAIEALLLAAKAHAELGDVRAVEASLERALARAERDGVLLPFALVPVRELLDRHPGHRTSHAALLSTVRDMLAGGAVEPEAPPLPDPLSDAELRIVRHLPSNLKATEIASELCVSPNTVRTHLRHIYAKLDAHTRSEAVARARRLGLLAPAGLSGR